jgi:cobalt-zinc-cadmium efflux system outer membrane protein
VRSVQPVAYQPKTGEAPPARSGAEEGEILAAAPLQLTPGPAPQGFDAEVSEPVDRSTGLGLDQLEAMALGNHPAVVEQRARVRAARGNWYQVGLPMNPVAQYQSDEIGAGGHSGLHSLQVSQTWVTANKLGLARGVAAAEVRREQADLERTELQVRTSVRTAFIAALIAQQRVEQTGGLRRLAERSMQSAQAMLDAAEVSRISLLQSQVATERAQLAYENALAGEQAARRRLTAASGRGAEITAPLRGDLERLLPELPWESLLEELVASSPETAAAEAELDRARRALQLACAQVTPNVTSVAGVGIDAGSDRAFARFGVSLPLPLRNRNEGNIAQARAEITAANAALGRVQFDLGQRLAQAVGRYRVARSRVETLRETVVPRAEETLELSRKAFEAGESNFQELLIVQRTLFQARLDALDAVEQAGQAAAEIDGMLVNTSSPTGSLATR